MSSNSDRIPSRAPGPGPRSQISRLKWQCRRGVKELDILLERYIETRYVQASAWEVRIFEELLALPDPDLLAYLMGYNQPDDVETARVIDAIVKPN